MESKNMASLEKYFEIPEKPLAELTWGGPLAAMSEPRYLIGVRGDTSHIALDQSDLLIGI